MKIRKYENNYYVVITQGFWSGGQDCKLTHHFTIEPNCFLHEGTYDQDDPENYDFEENDHQLSQEQALELIQKGLEQDNGPKAKTLWLELQEVVKTSTSYQDLSED